MIKRFSSTIITTDQPAFHYCLVGLAAVLPFLNSLDGEFVFDDGPAIVTNRDVLGLNPLKDLLKNDFWGNDVNLSGSHKSFRPVTTLSFRLTHSLFGPSPSAFHLGNLLLHLAVSCLVFWLAGRLKLKEYAALTAAVLFAVHPIHCEAVSSIVGRADLLAALFVLLGIFMWDKYQSVSLTICLTVLALLSKETGLVLPAVICLFDLLVATVRWRQGIPPKHLALIGITALLGCLRMSYTGSPFFSPADNPLIHEKKACTRLATIIYLPIFHLHLLVYPKELCFDWSMGSIPLVTSATDVRLWTSTVVYAVAGCYVYRERAEPAKMFCVSFGVLTFLPASNLLISVGFLAAERILYLPSVAYCILFVLVMEEVTTRWKCSSSHFMVVILALLFARTIGRNEDWRTAEALYSSAVRINPAKAYANLGQVLASKGDAPGALTAYNEALAHKNMADTWYNLGVLQSGLGNYSEAVVSYSRAISIRQSFAAAHLNIGLVLLKQARRREAEQLFTTCITLEGRQLKNWRAHWEAQRACHLQRGILRKADGRLTEARGDFLKIEEEDRLYPHAATHLAEMDIKMGNFSAAEWRLEDLLARHHSHTPAVLLFARNFSHKSSRAIRLLRRAIEISPDCADCLAELALLLVPSDPKQAETLFEQAAHLNPKKGQHLLNYAVILHKNEKFEAAERVYREVLRMEPDNRLATENFKKLERTIQRRKA